MKVKKAVITAAGFGSRFLPFVKNIPKEMLPIIDKPSIQLLVEDCQQVGIEEIIVVVRGKDNLIGEYFSKPADDVKALLDMQGRSERFVEVEKVLAMKNVRVIEQDPALPYGNGSPIVSAKPFLNPAEPFLMLFGDDAFLEDPGSEKGPAQLLEYFENNEMEGVTAVEKVSNKQIMKGAMIKPTGDPDGDSGQIEQIIEKPTEDQIYSNLFSFSPMILPYRIFDFLLPESVGKDGELWLQDANNKLAHAGKYMYKVLKGHYMTTGDPTHYLAVQLEYYLRSEKYGKEAAEIIKQLAARIGQP